MPTPKEARTLLIEGNLVRLQRTVVEREVKTVDWIAEITRQHPLQTGPLPTGCVWMARRSNAKNQTVSVFVVERPPVLQPVKFRPNRTIDEINDLLLSWPRTLWFVRCIEDCIQDVWLCGIVAPLYESGAETELFLLPMPNQYDAGHGHLCMGNLVVADPRPLAARIAELIGKVLDSLWNADLMPSFAGTGIEGLEDWHAKSATDPAFHEAIRFRPHAKGFFGGMIGHLLEAPA